MNIDPEKFQISITNELKVVQNRVRYLIGSANWGEEGRFKEAALSSVIRRFLPNNMSLGTGFIINNENDEIKISTQIDIIIYDNTYPVLFKEGDFIITTPENIKGIIEVKTKLKSTDISEVVSKATKNGNITNQKIFNGIFVYNKGNVKIERENINSNLKSALKESKGTVNHLCLGENIFIKFWENLNTRNNYSDGHYSTYKIKNISFSYFISNLLEHISKDQMTDRGWFLYPIKEGKEEHKIDDTYIQNFT